MADFSYIILYKICTSLTYYNIMKTWKGVAQTEIKKCVQCN